MFCGATTRDEGVKFMFTTDGPFGLVSMCNLCVRQADTFLRAEEAKTVNFKPGAPRGTDPSP